MKYKAWRNVLIGLEVFVLVMAIYGSVSLLVDAAGFGLKEECLRGSPFSNYQIPAVGLLVGVGGSSCLAVVALLQSRLPWGVVLSIVAGAILVVFEIVETYSIGLRNFQQPLMFVVGMLMVGLALLSCRSEAPGLRRTVPGTPKATGSRTVH